ncbi:MAG: hypothetical protein ACE5KM_18270 [Planctomycetaceae bacterium]
MEMLAKTKNRQGTKVAKTSGEQVDTHPSKTISLPNSMKKDEQRYRMTGFRDFCHFRFADIL